MIKLITFFLILLFTTPCLAEKHYVFIEDVGHVEKGMEAGQNELGDIIAICPYTPQYEPTQSELKRFKIIVVDGLTIDDIILLRERITKQEPIKLGSSKTITVTIKARKRKIKALKLKSYKQKQEVSRGEILSNLHTTNISPNNP